MAGPHRQVTGTHLYSERIRLPFSGNGEGLSRRGRPILHGPSSSSPERAVCQPQASGQGLQDPYSASSKNLLDTTLLPLEESITAVPQTVPHNTIDGSPPSCYEKFVAVTAQSLPALQDLDVSSLDKFIDEFTTTNGFQQSASSIGSSEELVAASSGTVSHDTGLASFSIFSREKFVAGAAGFASGKALQDLHFASSKELPNTRSMEESITAVPQTVPHKTIDGSPSTLQSSCEKFVSGAAETIPAMQDRDVSSLDKFLDEILNSLSGETITADPKIVTHNTIDSSPSTLQSSCKKVVSGSAVTILTLQDQYASFVNKALDELIRKRIGSSSEESTTASPRTVPHNATSFLHKAVDECIGELNGSSSEELATASLRTVPHNATNGFEQPASSVGSKILIRHPRDCYQSFYIRMDRMGSFWTYPDVGGPFPSIDEADVAIIYFIDELRHGARCKEQYEFSRGDSNYSYFLNGPPKRDPNSQSSKTTYDEKQYLVQALLDQYNGDNDLFGDVAHELKDLVKMHWIHENPCWYYHFNFTTKQLVADSTGNKLFFAEVSHLQGENAFEINRRCIIETDEDYGDHCYGCRNNRDPMQHPKNTNAYTGRHWVDGPGVIFSDYDDDDDYDNYDDDDDDDVDFVIDDDNGYDDDDGEDDNDGEDGEVDDVVEDCNVGHSRPRLMLDVFV